MKKECCNINEVVQEYYDFLKAYIIKKTQNPDVADDLVQQVMLKLIDSHAKTPEVKNIKAWLFQVSRNTIYDYYKSKDIQVDLENDWELRDEAASENAQVVTADYVVPMINMLDPKYAVPLKMSDIDGHSQQQIADELHLSLSATKMRVQRGRTKLKELFVTCCDISYDQHGGIIGCTIKAYCTPLQEVKNKLES